MGRLYQGNNIMRSTDNPLNEAEETEPEISTMKNKRRKICAHILCMLILMKSQGKFKWTRCDFYP